MSVLLYDRAVKLTVAPPVKGSFRTVKTQSAMVITNLRIRFKVAKTLRKEPNNSKIYIHNLNATSRAQLQGKGARVWLEAGYQGALGQVFVGDVRYIEHRHDGTDWVTELELGDGERAYRNGRVNVSFKAGTPRADILKKLAQQSGWDLGNVASFYASFTATELNGFTAVGPAHKALEALLAKRGLTFSVQDGAIQILPLSGYLPAAALQLDSSHGLVGAPEFGSPPTKTKPRMLKLKSLLQAQLLPGVRVSLTSTTHTGLVVVQKVEHDGDTHGREWYSSMEALTA